MDKYGRIVKALGYCARSECSQACPYYGETKGGRSCRQWLCIDAALAIERRSAEVDGFVRELEKAEDNLFRMEAGEND